jgi:hypothetical protein
MWSLKTAPATVSAVTVDGPAIAAAHHGARITAARSRPAAATAPAKRAVAAVTGLANGELRKRPCVLLTLRPRKLGAQQLAMHRAVFDRRRHFHVVDLRALSALSAGFRLNRLWSQVD